MRRLAAGGAVLAVSLALCLPAAADPTALFSRDFTEIAPQGFGDRQNNAAWSMEWYKGHLFVGTVRAWYCWGAAWFDSQLPALIPYPPKDPDIECAADPTDLPLQAEIWRYTPSTGTWKRVYQAPRDVPIPGHPGKFTSRDVGYRAMAVFTDPDGTEALYVGGTTINVLWPPLPPPRILRSADGETFAPVPQDPGTFLASPPAQGGFRSMVVHNGRLYMVNGKIRGEGVVLEARKPARGNNKFRQITPPGMTVFAVASLNGFLYVGVVDSVNGYSVLKTDAQGPPPYRFVPVVTHGGFLRPLPSNSPLYMHAFNGRLYVGLDQPAEVIRINPDDSWDVVVGKPRLTPTGLKEPLSGLDAGFDWPLNVHIWRMQAHEGALYVGTLDNSTRAKVVPGVDDLIGNQYGFDFYRSADGFYFVPITTNGLGDKFQLGLRSLASTPEGLFVGGVSIWSGLRVWQGVPTPARIEPPVRLEVEQKQGAKRMILSWERPARAFRFRVFRSSLITNGFAETPGEPREIGTTTATVFVDSTVQVLKRYHYFVVAEKLGGAVSGPSNLVRAPSLASPVTFEGLGSTVLDWAGAGGLGLVAQLQAAAANLTDAKDYDAALAGLEAVGQMAEDDSSVLPPWRVEDLKILLVKLARRVGLARGGYIAVEDLF